MNPPGSMEVVRSSGRLVFRGHRQVAWSVAMPDDFDPYHVWLGIPPDEQPANRYRLLGIRAFESNPDVIDNAADRQTVHLRTFQGGKHGLLRQRLLNEVASARVGWLNPHASARYNP